MITSEYYEKDFQEFLHYKKYDDIEEALSYSKSFDIENFNMNVEETNNKIVDEVKTWKKFHRNNFRKANIRDFEPFVTQGAIADFIESQLNLFDKSGNLLPLSDIIQNKIQKELLVVRRATSKLDAIHRSGLLFNEIKDRFADPVKKEEIERGWQQYLIDAKTNVTAEDVYNTIKKSLPKPLKKILGGNTQKELVDFLFGNLTNFDISSDNISDILLKDWNSFLRNSFFGTKNKIRSKDVFDTVLKVFNNYQGDFENVKKLFSLNFNDTVSKFLNKKFNQLDFGITIRKVVRTYGRQAFRSSIKILGLSPSDFRVVERLIVNTVANESEKFILGLAGKLGQGLVSIGDSLVKSDSWINKTINKIWQLGKLSADRNGLYEWVYGDTKHCASCLKANGQRHRLIHWHNAGILPQSNGSRDLICKGFYCKCKLVKVTGTARGRLDRIPMAS